MTTSQFVEALAQAPGLPNLFNPFRHICPVHDSPESPTIRRNNLQKYLDAHLRLQSKELWIAEAPSQRGSRRTGVYFVPEPKLETMANRLQVKALKKATHTPEQAPTATRQFWQVFDELEHLPVTYNALPFHPHHNGYALVNRTPTKRELVQHLPYLEMLLELFQPERILVLGRKAEYACAKLGIPTTYVRHPSQGGQKAFLEKTATIYGLQMASVS